MSIWMICVIIASKGVYVTADARAGGCRVLLLELSERISYIKRRCN